MTRERLIWDKARERLVPADEFRRTRYFPARSELPSPMLIRDFQEPVFSHADGTHYTSRSHWREHLKANGMVELGNDMPKGPEPERALSPQALGEAYDQCAQGHGAKLPERPPEHWEGPVEGDDDG